MKRKTWSYFLAIILGIAVYGYDYYLNEKDNINSVLESENPRRKTNSFYLPTSTTHQIIHHNEFSLSYSEKHEQAEWVAYELKATHLSKKQHKRPYFKIDKAVKTGAASWRNFKNSGFDRGHLCPAGDKRYSKEAHDETFLTSNISPQEHQFNSGIWNKLEQKVRYWARKYDGVFVVTGGVLKGQMKTIGKENVSVPNQFYKVLIDYNSGKIKMIAFLMPHKASKKPLHEFVVSVDEIERLTGIDFFPELDDAIENKLEASNSSRGWRF